MNIRKRDCERAVRTTISMPPALWQMATAMQKARQLATFSDCMQELIRLAAAAEQQRGHRTGMRMRA